MEQADIQNRIEELSGRLDRLAAKNRRLRLIGVGLGACLAAAVAFHFASAGPLAVAQEKAEPGPVKATSFQVVDDSGKLMAELKSKDKSATLALMGSEGKPRLILVGGDNPGVLALDQDGTTRAIFGYEKKSGPLIVLKDSKNNNRLVMGGDDKSMSLVLLSPEKKNRLIVSGADAPAVLMCDENATPRTIVGFEGKSGPFMALRDENGKNRMVAAFGGNTIGYSVLDEDGKPVWTSKSEKSEKTDK
ncbi:MAG: hypothetical protein HZA50_08165 [Planctomycetes bacterium]|nr:hypothetical protein [Planctomycetota bacterium]